MYIKKYKMLFYALWLITEISVKIIYDLFIVKNIKIWFHSFWKGTSFIYKTPFVCLTFTYVLETAKWKDCRPTYHLMTSANGILSYVLTNKCYFLTWWMIINRTLALLYLMTIGIFMYSQTKRVTEQIAHKNQYIVRHSKQIPLLFIQCKICWMWNIFMYTFVTVFLYAKIIAESWPGLS